MLRTSSYSSSSRRSIWTRRRFSLLSVSSSSSSSSRCNSGPLPPTTPGSCRLVAGWTNNNSFLNNNSTTTNTTNNQWISSLPRHYYYHYKNGGGHVAGTIIMARSNISSLPTIVTFSSSNSSRSCSVPHRATTPPPPPPPPPPPRSCPASSSHNSKSMSSLARDDNNNNNNECDDVWMTTLTNHHSTTTTTTQKLYFDPEKSPAEWRILTDELLLLLQTQPLVVVDEDGKGHDAGARSRRLLLCMDNNSDDDDDDDDDVTMHTTTKQNIQQHQQQLPLPPPLIIQAIYWWSFQRSPQGVHWGMALYEHLCRAIVDDWNKNHNNSDDNVPGKRRRRRREEENAWIYWYSTGRFPQSTHLLNALLDSWRVCRQSIHHQQQQQLQQHPFVVPTPAQMWQRVQALAGTPTDIPLNQRTYSLLTQAATADASAAVAAFMDKRHHHHNSNNNNSRQRSNHRYSNNNNSSTKRRPRRGRQEERSHALAVTTDDLIKVVETVPYFCEDLLQSMLESGQTYPPALPDTIAFTTVMKAWAILGKMQQQLQQQQQGGNTASSSSSSSAAAAAAAADPCDPPAQRALQLLTKMQQLYQNRVIDARPNTITYNTLLEVLTNAGQIERAEEILRHTMMMIPLSHGSGGINQQQQHHHHFAPPPDTVSFRIVIYGWAASYHHHNRRHQVPPPQQRENDQHQVVEKVDWFDRAYRLLQEMQNWQQRQEEQEPGSMMMMMTDSSSCSSSSSSSSSHNNNIHHPAKVQVDASFYSRLISSLAKDGQYQRAENLYLEMQDRFASCIVGGKKNQESSIASTIQQQQQEDEAKTPLLLLQLLDDCRAKRAMIMVYAKTKRPRQAEQMLKELEQQIEDHTGQWPQQSAAVVCDIAPKASHYRDVIDSWATTRNSIKMSKTSTSRRQQQSGSVVVDDNDDDEGLDRGEQLLLRMMDKSMFGGRPDLTPSVQLIDRVLCNWIDKRRRKTGNDSEGCYRAESLLRLLEERLAAVAGGGGQEQLPSVSVLQEGRSLFFGRVIHAWSQCSLFEAPERAESLLWEMQQHCNDENNNEASMRPTRFHYCSVVTAWGQSGRADAAENAKEIFAIALDQYQMGHQVARPDTALYLAVIHACARARDANGVKQYTQQLLDDGHE